MTPAILIIGIIVAMTGKVLLGYAVFRVHTRVMQEHRIDDEVIDSIKKERQLAIWAIALIIVGTFLEVFFYLNAPFV